jgi:acyl-coenzyme A synthetase/AMP-(fatty) acid ligase
MNVIDAIRHHCRMRPHDTAVVHPSGALDYLQLAALISCVAARLRSEGIGCGERVAIFVSDPLTHLALILAAMVNGTATISAHPNRDPIPAGAEIGVILADSTLSFATSLRIVNVAADWLQAQKTARQPLLSGEGFAGPESIARMFTSSGTTGLPKVIGHSEANLHGLAVASLLFEPLLYGPSLAMLSLSTLGGWGTAHSTLWHGCTLVLATAPTAILRAIKLYGITFVKLSPQQLQGLLDALKTRAMRFPSLRRLEVAGAPVPLPLLVAARATLCPNIVGVYGATEVGLVAQSPTSLLQARRDVAGYVAPGVRVRIVDEAGNPVPPGAEGIVQIRTPCMVHSYLGDPQASATGFRDGWFVPGDMGALGDDGLLQLRGRIDELINTGGVKVSPARVDEFLLTQPGVRDAAAFAFRQSGRNDEIWAAVVADDDLNHEALLAACRATLNSRAPTRIVRMSEIPRSALGKPMRKKLSQDANAIAV